MGKIKAHGKKGYASEYDWSTHPQSGRKPKPAYKKSKRPKKLPPLSARKPYDQAMIDVPVYAVRGADAKETE